MRRESRAGVQEERAGKVGKGRPFLDSVGLSLAPGPLGLRSPPLDTLGWDG